MRPEELADSLTSMRVAADVVEALDSPALQVERCWELAGWDHGWAPFGVRFARWDGRGQVTAAVVAVALPESRRDDLARAYAGFPWPTTLLLLG